MKILGIDYGEKRIGVSISDENRKIAFPKCVIERDASSIKKIGEMVSSEDIDLIIIGESKDYKMKDNPIMKSINSFKENLEKDLDITVKLHPEVMTSIQAEKMIGEKNKMIDASAATIMLQSYLDSKN